MRDNLRHRDFTDPNPANDNPVEPHPDLFDREPTYIGFDWGRDPSYGVEVSARRSDDGTVEIVSLKVL